MKLQDIKESVQGLGYGSVNVSDKTTKELNSIIKKLGISNSIKDLHLTMIYDTSNPSIDMKLDPTREYTATVSDIKMLGEPNTKWYAIALTLDSPELSKRHDEYTEAGFKHSYPEFLPHVSLKYSPTKDDISTITKNLKLFKDIKLVFNGEQLKKIKD